MHTADFQRVLATPSRSRSTHFAVHHMDSRPSAPARRPAQVGDPELSTAGAPKAVAPVDELPGAPDGHWLGAVVPKRHAKRSVTRSLLKRQIRSALQRHAGVLPPGLWLVRLRAPFATPLFPSAASSALRRAAQAELEQVLARAVG